MVVAFLQNLWVKDPDRVQSMLAGRNEQFRRALLKRLLFAGGLTGKRLRSTFGDLCDEIIWEEASRGIAGNASGICAPDPEHIRNVLNELCPDIVVTFGKIAGDAVSQCWIGELIRLPHPAARQIDIIERLKQGAEKLRPYVSNIRKPGER